MKECCEMAVRWVSFWAGMTIGGCVMVIIMGVIAGAKNKWEDDYHD